MKPPKIIFLFLIVHQLLLAQEGDNLKVNTFKISKPAEQAPVANSLLSCCNVPTTFETTGVPTRRRLFKRKGGNRPAVESNAIITPKSECSWEGTEHVSLQRPTTTKTIGTVRLCYMLNDSGALKEIVVMEGVNEILNRAAVNYLRTMEIPNLEAKMRTYAKSDKPVRFAMSIAFYEKLR